MSNTYDPSTDVGIPSRPAGENVIEYPSGASESPRTPNVFFGNGSPEGVIVGIIGDLYHRQDGSTGTTLYVKETGTGNTGWRASPVALAVHCYEGWFIDNAAASQTNTAAKRFTSTGASTQAYGASIIVPKDGTVTGILVGPNGIQTAGTITFNVYDEFAGGTIGASVAMIASNFAPTWYRTNGSFSSGQIVVAGIGTAVTANQPLSLRYTSTGTLSPTTMDQVLGLEITESAAR